jgi:hypothetical protein
MAQQARDLAELLPDPHAKAKLETHALGLETEAALLERIPHCAHLSRASISSR